MIIHRTHDGQSFDIAEPISSFQSIQDLFDLIASLTEIPSEDVICMTREGIQVIESTFDRIQEEEDRQLSSSFKKSPILDQLELFCFNLQFLYVDDLRSLVQEIEDVAPILPPIIEPELYQPFTPRMLDNLLEWCNGLLSNMMQHNSQSEQRLSQLRIIDDGTRAALTNLLNHGETIRDGTNELATLGGEKLEQMKNLLDGHQIDFKILSMVKINTKLLSGPKERNLASFVSQSKMGAVYDVCMEVYAQMSESLNDLTTSDNELYADTNGLRGEVESTDTEPSNESFQAAEEALHRATELHTFLHQHCAPDEQGWPAAERLARDENMVREVEDAKRELILLDEVCRESLRRLSTDRNDMTSRCLHLLQEISGLELEWTGLRDKLNVMLGDFRSDRTDGFRHLDRLRNMLLSYGSTLIEIYRRNEFERQFVNRSQALAELMANFSENERKRRSDFKDQLAGALPWDIKGMDGNAPSLEMSTGRSNGMNANIDIDRSDVDGLFQALDEIEEVLRNENQPNFLSHVRSTLQALFDNVQETEAEFIRLVEVTLLEQHDDTESEDGGEKPNGRRLVQERLRLERELQDIKMEHAQRERSAAEAHDERIKDLQAEVSRLKTELRGTEHALEQEKAHHDETKRDLDTVKNDADTESARRHNMQDELTRLRQEVEVAHRAEKEAKAEVREETDRVSELETHLSSMQIELEEVRSAHHDASKRVEALLNKGTSFEDELRTAQDRIDELTQYLTVARLEAREVREALSEAETARDKALRSYRAEADGDRAILEESLRTKTAELEEAETLLRRRETEAVEHTDSIKNMQSQLTAADEAHENLVRQYESAKEASLNAEMEKRQSERNLGAVIEKARILITKSVLLSEALQKMPSLSKNTSKNGTKSVQETIDEVDEQTEKQRKEAIQSYREAGEQPPLDVILDILNWLTKTSSEDAAITKMESLMTQSRKWAKAYKNINEKGQRQQMILREKITFRNFAIGDLALFLPTRSSVNPSQTDSIENKANEKSNFLQTKPWAAFNINFPHYFLNFTGTPENEQLRDSLRQKEWIVARITKIESRTATSSNPDGNPFHLAEGVKFYLLDVESWNAANSTVPPSVTRRKSTSTATTSTTNNTKDVVVPPSLRRWESTPDTHSIGEVKVENDTATINESNGNPTSAEEEVKNTEPPIAEEKPTSSPTSTMRSALSIALQQSSTSPEHLRNNRQGFIGKSSTRRSVPINGGRVQVGMTSGSVASSASTTTSESHLNRFSESAMPAFGRNNARLLNQGGGGAFVRKSEANTNDASGTVSRSVPDSSGSKPINAFQRAIRAADIAPNPFSASPALATLGENGGFNDYLSSRQSTTGAGQKSGLDKNDSIVNSNNVDKGKMKENSTLGNTVADDTLANGHRRPGSRNSMNSVSSRISGLTTKSRPSAFYSPRIRTPALPKSTIETAQGSNSFKHSVQTYDDGIGTSTSPHSDGSRRMGSGFSALSSNIAASESTGGDSNFSANSLGLPVNSRSPVKRSTSISSVAESNTASPSTSRRSIFGTSWTLGRRSASQILNSPSSNNVLTFEENEEQTNEDLSATVTDATTSLRKFQSRKK